MTSYAAEGGGVSRGRKGRRREIEKEKGRRGGEHPFENT
jgi:hypothetical protein